MAWIWSATAGEVTVSVRMRMPAPLTGFCAASTLAQGAEEVVPGADFAPERDGLRAVGIVELEHRGLGEGVARAQGAGCSGLPSILVGRPSWLSTSTPVATPFSVVAVA